MNRIIVGSSALILFLIVHPATAAVFSRDWKAPGDGLLTYDDMSQREWLDLSQSRLSQFPEPRLQNAISQLAPGGLFEKFTWASQQDVRDLAVSSGVDVTTSNIAINQVPVTNLIGLLSPTLQSSGVLRSIGLTIDPQTNPSLPPYTGAALLVNFNPSTGGGYAEFRSLLPDDLLTPTSNGLMLFRTVPEPSSSILVVISIFAAAFLRRKRVG